jgi:hypothetical protein
MDMHRHFVGEASLHFQLELYTLGFLSVPTYKYVTEVSMLLGYTAKTESLRTYIDINFFPCSVVGNSLLNVFKVF